MEKLCGSCGTHKPPSEFYRVPVGPKGTCKACVIAKEKARYIAHPRVYPPGGLKRCSRCKETKPIAEFSRAATKDGLNYYCRPCSVASVTETRRRNPENHRASSRRWNIENPEHVRDARLQRRLGIPHGTYDQLFAAQEGRCAICGTDKPSLNPKFRHFHVDHSKETGKVRGLLCGRCNTGIGQLRHNEDILQSSIDYLRRTN